MRSRTGLSRIEVLVALILAVVAGGLFLAAVGRVRESAVRMSCGNNLKQLALAAHNYTSANKDLLPPLVDLGEGAPTGKGIPSLFANVMPYIEASPGFFHELEGWEPNRYHAHSSVSFRCGGSDGDVLLSGGRVNRGWQTFLCPADATGGGLHTVARKREDGTDGSYASGLRDVQMTLPDGTTGYYAVGSYATNGLLHWGSGKIGEFPGGTSNTVLLAERPQVCTTASGETVYNLWGVGFYSPHMPAFAALTPSEPPGLWSTGQIAPTWPLPHEKAADRDGQIQYRVGVRDAAPQSLDVATPFQMLRKGQTCDPRLPGTPHKAGMQVAMADGSVRTLARDTSPWVFWSVCTWERAATDLR